MKISTPQKKKFLVLFFLIIFCGLLSYFFEKAGYQQVYTHLFYIPIVLSCVWWQRRGIFVALFLGAVVVASHFIFSNGPVFDDALRALIFLVVASFVAQISISEKNIRIALEQEIKEFENKSKELSSEKDLNKTKSEFLSLASHQLRTPPTIINWYTEVLQSGDLGPINDKQAAYLNEICDASRRMVSVVGSLLNVSRIEMGTFAISIQKIDMKDIINKTVEELKKRFDGQIELKTDYCPKLDLFKADPTIMQIILDNLLSNAIKYGRRGETKIEIATKIENDALLLSVKDNGIGIPAKDQGRIFEKVFRADNAASANPDGTGLGLYMTKKIVEGSGGKIWFDSKENEGAMFYISFPASGMKEKIGTTKLARISQL